MPITVTATAAASDLTSHPHPTAWAYPCYFPCPHVAPEQELPQQGQNYTWSLLALASGFQMQEWEPTMLAEHQLPLSPGNPPICWPCCGMYTHSGMAKGWGARHLYLGSIP